MDYTQNYAVKFDAQSFQLGVEASTTTITWDNDILVETTTYTNISGDIWILAAAYQFVTTGTFP